MVCKIVLDVRSMLSVLLLLAVAEGFAAPTVPVPAVWTIYAHEAEVVDIAFSPDEQFLASVGDDDLLKIRHVPGGDLVFTYVLRDPNAVAFSPRSNLLVAASYDRVLAWRVPAFTPVWTNNYGTRNLAFSADGQSIVGCFSSEYGHAYVYRATDGTFLQPSIGVRDFGYRTAAFTPDGSRLLAGFQGIRVFNTSNWLRERDIPGGEGFVLSPDGRLIAQPGAGGVAAIDFVTGAYDTRFEGTNQTYAVAWLEGGKQLIGTTSAETIRIWDASSGKAQWVFTGAEQGRTIASSPVGNYFAYGATSGAITLAATPPIIRKIEPLPGGALRLEWTGGHYGWVQYRSAITEGEWTDIPYQGGRAAYLYKPVPGFYRVRDGDFQH
jgi:WD40 repeat protein